MNKTDYLKRYLSNANYGLLEPAFIQHIGMRMKNLFLNKCKKEQGKYISI